MALTLKQDEFAKHYAVSRHAANAYRAAYEVGAETLDSSVRASAAELLADPAVAQRISELTAAADEAVILNLKKIFELIAAGITADPNELTGLKVGACRWCWGVDHAYHWKDFEFVDACDQAAKTCAPIPDCSGGFGFKFTREPCPDCPRCEGRGAEYATWGDTTKLSPGAKFLFQGVKQTRNGLEVLMLDKSKLIDMAVRMQGGFKDNVNLGGSLTGLLANVDLSEMSPMDAARTYAEMVAGKK